MNPKNKKILIVDDEVNIATILAESLHRSNAEYQVDTAENAQEALQKCKQQTYDLVITDFRMPGMTGIELGKTIRKLSPTTHIFLMTAFDSQDIRHAAKQVDLDGYLQKPVPFAEIRRIAKEAVGRTQQANQRKTETITNEQIKQQVRNLYLDTGANSVLLLHAEGHLILQEGHRPDLDLTAVSTLVAANFMAAVELARLLGNDSVFRSSSHEGPDYDIYAYDINGKYLLAVIFGAESKTGVVRLYTKQTATKLKTLLANSFTTNTLPSQDDMPATIASEVDELLGLLP